MNIIKFTFFLLAFV